MATDDLQKIICYVNADSPAGVITDSSGAALVKPPDPMIVRGIDTLLCIRLLQDGTKYPAEKLAYDLWACDYSDDWKDSTPPLMEADNENITLNATDEYTELQIPLLASNTPAIISKIIDKDKISLGMELTGYIEGNPKAKFALQFNLTIRNRRNMSGGTPDEPVETYWTINEILAWGAAKVDKTLASSYDDVDEIADTDRFFLRKGSSSKNGTFTKLWTWIVSKLAAAGYSKTYKLTFDSTNITGTTTKILSVNHALNDKYALHVTIANGTTGKRIRFDEITYVDADNLTIDCTEDFADMSGDYYLRITT